MPVHPSEALFAGEKSFPAIPVCEHYAGSERLIAKALTLQQELGPLFDLTCDCEDGARTGDEAAHVAMAARQISGPDNRHERVGARIHDPSHPHWRKDVDVLVGEAGARLAYLTIPKVTGADDVSRVIEHVGTATAKAGLSRTIPLHVLIETHGALAQVQAIARLPGLEVLDFGLMDFVSGHHGAIPASAMRSPGQFEHHLLARAKAEIAAAALANGLVPSHNVTLDLKDAQRTYEDARRARQQFGYLRMWSIHPLQIRPIINAMKPAQDEVEQASAILLAAQAAGWGPIQHDGELHDRATYRYYWQVLQKAQLTGVAVSQAALSAFFPDHAH